MKENIKIGFIGCGRVGSSLAKYFKQKGLEVIGVYDRTQQNGIDIAKFVKTDFFPDYTDLISKSDIIFITVSDSAIKSVWNEIYQNENSYLKNKIFVHCSGAISSEIFTNPNNFDFTACSLHPAQAFCDKYKSYLDLNKTVFTLEYNPKCNCNSIHKMKYLVEKIGNKYATINAQSKIKYHAACVMASNLAVALMQYATDTIEECGVNQEIAKDLLGSLMVGNANNILANGTIKALTGPIDRADVGTVNSHLQQLNGASKGIYIKLSQKLIEIAKIKNPNKDYNELEKLLEDNKK